MNNYLIIGISVLALGLTVQTYRAHNLSVENTTLSEQSKYFTGYVKKYEASQLENKAMSDQLTQLLENVHDDPKCLISAPVRNVIGRLR